MLKGISPILTPELLKILAEMGHGDELVIGDCNFPAQSMGRRCARASLRWKPKCAGRCSSAPTTSWRSQTGA